MENWIWLIGGGSFQPLGFLWEPGQMRVVPVSGVSGSSGTATVMVYVGSDWLSASSSNK